MFLCCLFRWGGSSFTKYAFEVGFADVWEPTLDDPVRDRVTVLISDGLSTPHQEPCEVIPTYKQHDIHVVEIAFSSVTDCTNEVETYFVDDAANTVTVIESLFQTEYCYDYSVETPFTGGYLKTEEIINGQPVHMFFFLAILERRINWWKYFRITF